MKRLRKLASTSLQELLEIIKESVKANGITDYDDGYDSMNEDHDNDIVSSSASFSIKLVKEIDIPDDKNSLSYTSPLENEFHDYIQNFDANQIKELFGFDPRIDLCPEDYLEMGKENEDCDFSINEVYVKGFYDDEIEIAFSWEMAY